MNDVYEQVMGTLLPPRESPPPALFNFLPFDGEKCVFHIDMAKHEEKIVSTHFATLPNHWKFVLSSTVSPNQIVLLKHVL